MNDTSPEMERLVRERYAAMTPQERFLIGISMCRTARALVEASFPAGLSEDAKRRMMCERLYPELVAQAYGDT
jgi:hypothetical protein